ncbi:MAG: hypothetical protein ABFD69_07415 [Candidatus Sumerlaeia bacterium]
MQGAKRYLSLTCDVEALPAEATSNHVDRLIWCRYPGVPFGAGIDLMMDIADEFGAKITFFLDVCERHAYGSAIDEAARMIQERGHDLQLHLHIEFLNPYWQELGYKPPTWAMNQFNEEAAQLAIDHAVETFVEMAGVRPIAYRGGAFRYNQSILRALKAQDIKLSYQYYPLTCHLNAYPYGCDAGVLPVFRWSNGLHEIPMGCLKHNQSSFHYNGFSRIMDPKHALHFMRQFYGLGPRFNTLVMLLHSWSFLVRNENRVLEWKDKSLINAFREFLASLPPDVETVTAPQLLRKIELGEIEPAFEMPLCVAGTEALRLLPAPARQAL